MEAHSFSTTSLQILLYLTDCETTSFVSQTSSILGVHSWASISSYWISQLGAMTVLAKRCTGAGATTALTAAGDVMCPLA